MGWFSRVFNFIFTFGRRRAETELDRRIDATDKLTDEEKAALKGGVEDALDEVKAAGAEQAAKLDAKTGQK